VSTITIYFKTRPGADWQAKIHIKCKFPFAAIFCWY